MGEKIEKNMNYINNKNLLEELKIYKETGERTEELGRMFLLLARRYSSRGSFSGYSWKDDMICEAVLTCIKYMHNFDVTIDKPNPFAYFSRIIHNAFLNYIAKQKIHSKIKDICYKNLDFITPDESEDDIKNFDIHGIDYQCIRGNKKKKRKKSKK
jgi:DNA-directed RNA polymerase specialized sigma24 family protein